MKREFQFLAMDEMTQGEGVDREQSLRPNCPDAPALKVGCSQLSRCGQGERKKTRREADSEAKLGSKRRE